MTVSINQSTLINKEILCLSPCLGGGDGGDGGGGSVACGQMETRAFLSLFVRLMKQVADLESEISSSRKHLSPIQMPTSNHGSCRCYGTST